VHGVCLLPFGGGGPILFLLGIGVSPGFSLPSPVGAGGGFSISCLTNNPNVTNDAHSVKRVIADRQKIPGCAIMRICMRLCVIVLSPCSYPAR